MLICDTWIGRKSFFDSLNLYFEFSKYNIYYLVFLYLGEYL